MSQNLQNFVKFQKFQIENLVDIEKCCKTHIFLQKSVPIQPKTNNILPKFCQKLTTTLRIQQHVLIKNNNGGFEMSWTGYIELPGTRRLLRSVVVHRAHGLHGAEAAERNL